MVLDEHDVFRALEASVVRLRNLAEGLNPEQLRVSAYPSEWTVADVLSHLGCSAEIVRLDIEASVTERELTGDYTTPIWETWNAKSEGAQLADALAADRELIERVESLTTEERAAVRVAFGPVELDLAGTLGARLNEHAVHSWDIDVAFDPAATIPADAAGIVVDNIELITQFAGTPDGTARALHVRTSEPRRDFTLTTGADGVALVACADDHAPDLELPAEALIRLVYGRLDPDHTPAAVAGAELGGLRGVFRGL